MAVEKPIVTCGECELHLEEDPGAETTTRVPCPACGSLKRTILVTIKETINIKSKLGMKGRHASGGKPFIEQISGDDLHRDSGQWRKLNRTIDRENDHYYEVVTDPETGEILHECKEPLSEHRGHGAAKVKSKKKKG